MEEIIKQIAQIDAVAFNTKKANEEALQKRKQHYEKELTEYKEEALAKAKKEAEKAYEEIMQSGKAAYEAEEKQCKRLTLHVKDHYLKVRERLLNQVFEELFEMEG